MKNESSVVEEMVRVNHAGEYGAMRIYAGQLFVLGNDRTIEHMAGQEKEHFNAFQKIIIERKIRPSFLQPLWHVGGFAMGALTAFIGRNAAHACTVAVENVIDKHYQEQLLDVALNDDTELKNIILKCHQDECEHRDTAINESGEDLELNYPILTNIIKTIAQCSINIAKRI